MRLELEIATELAERLNYFNSIKVRLELHVVGIYAVSPVFQFHKGAIRTDGDDGILAAYLEFQFHKGAIRT